MSGIAFCLRGLKIEVLLPEQTLTVCTLLPLDVRISGIKFMGIASYLFLSQLSTISSGTSFWINEIHCSFVKCNLVKPFLKMAYAYRKGSEII